MRVICCLIICLAQVFIIAEEFSQDLKTQHNKLQKENNVSGNHYFGVFNNFPASVYASENKRSIYSQYQQKEFLRIVAISGKGDKIKLSFQDKIIIGEKTYSADYDIYFHTGSKFCGYHVLINSEEINLGLETKRDKITSSLLKYASRLYETVQKCNKKNLDSCLNIIDSGVEVYQNYKNEDFISPFPTISSPSNQQLVYKTIAFEWRWNYRTGFKATPIYKEMDYSIIGFDSVKINHAKNAWNIRIQATPIGNNTAQIALGNVSFMAHPRFWASFVSGSIRCVMQK